MLLAIRAIRTVNTPRDKRVGIGQSLEGQLFGIVGGAQHLADQVKERLHCRLAR